MVEIYSKMWYFYENNYRIRSFAIKIRQVKNILRGNYPTSQYKSQFRKIIKRFPLLET